MAKNDVPKDIAEMIIESVNSCGKVDGWTMKTGSYQTTYEIRVNDVKITSTKDKNYVKYGLIPGHDYFLTLDNVEYIGGNTKDIFNCIAKNYEKKCIRPAEEKKEGEIREKFSTKENELREKFGVQ